MSNKKETPVSWLVQRIIDRQNGVINEFPIYSLDQIFEQAKEMEKQQIIDAYHCGRAFENKYPDSAKTYDESANQYYTETYGGQNNE
jgi:hypothetical protein